MPVRCPPKNRHFPPRLALRGVWIPSTLPPSQLTMEKVRRVFAVPSQGYAYTSRVDDKTVAENEARRAEALSLLTKAAHMMGYHPEELDVARQSLPDSLRDLEIGGWLPSHVAVHLLRRIEGLAGMAALADELSRAPEIRLELEKRLKGHADRGRAWQENSPHTGGWTKSQKIKDGAA